MPTTMTTDTKPRIPAADLEKAVRTRRIKSISDDRLRALRKWLQQEITARTSERALLKSTLERHRAWINGKNPEPPIRPGMSNITVPLLMWARTAVLRRLIKGIFDQNPWLTVEPLNPTPDDGTDTREIAKTMGRALRALITNQDDFDGRTASERACADDTDIGACAIKVIVEPTTWTRTAPVTDDGEPVLTPRGGAIKWHHIPFTDLLYFRGYGTDANRMPFIGHRVRRTWTEMQQWAANDDYDSAALEEIAAYYEQEDANLPAASRRHEVAELYLDYIIDDTRIPSAIVVDYHIQADVICRVAWNDFGPDRPIGLAQFDMPASPGDLKAPGIPDKLDAAQEEANAIHNIGIEAGKRGIAHVTIIKKDSALDAALDDDEDLMPGATYTTETPDEDIIIKPLGDPRAAESAIALEEHVRIYVTRILGLDEARVGNVEAGSRVPASLGLPTMREGRIVIEGAMSSVASMIARAATLSLRAMQRNWPGERLNALLGTEAATAMARAAFIDSSPPDAAYRVIVRAQDVATALDAKKQEILVFTQFLMTFMERLAGLGPILFNPQAPEPYRNFMLDIAEKLNNSVTLMLGTLESVPNADEVLLDVESLRRDVDAFFQQGASPAAGGGPTGPGGPALTDLGGGVV